MLRIEQISLQNFRCFDALEVSFEPDLTVLFAENAGGKTALLTALAMGLALLQPSHPRALTLRAQRDARRTARGELTGTCSLRWVATIGDRAGVAWRVETSPTSRRRVIRLRRATDAIEDVRSPGVRWPLIGYYGTGRLAADGRPIHRGARPAPDRMEGYADCLESSTKEAPLLEWIRSEALGDVVRQGRGERTRGFAGAVLSAIQRATPGVSDIWYDPAVDSPVALFSSGREASWAELSDGYHVFMGLVGDIARRAVILNEQDGAHAPLLVEGVVLIDEIDLHLHPRWQRVVLECLRAAFPKLQFIVTTHSPQVLSSAENRQVRRLVNWKLKEGGVFVEGRDSNAILREEMGTDDRDERRGAKLLRELYAAIDSGEQGKARALLADLRARWGELDPELIRAEGFLDEEG